MNQPPTVLHEWKGRGWWVWVTDDHEMPLRVNTASAAPDGRLAMTAEDALYLSNALKAAANGADRPTEGGA